LLKNDLCKGIYKKKAFTMEDFATKLTEIWDLAEKNGGNVSSEDFMLGMDICSKMCYDDRDDLLYEFGSNLLKDRASMMSTKVYEKTSRSFIRMASYIHRFYVPNRRLTPFSVIASEAALTCRDRFHSLLVQELNIYFMKRNTKILKEAGLLSKDMANEIVKKANEVKK